VVVQELKPAGVARPTKSDRTRESILVSAEVLFSERGFDATTLDAIGEQAGMQGTAILYHYASKRVLYEAVLDRMFAPMLDEVHHHLEADLPVDERYAAVTTEMVRFAAAGPAAARLILREASAGSAEAGDIVGSASQRQWISVLDALDAGADRDPSRVSTNLWCGTSWSVPSASTLARVHWWAASRRVAAIQHASPILKR
jgi:AcrR family transcriptional regulator